ncbi:hypothetical protein EX30DRAFT_325915 [Ascodesmis nigricans]|uniref:Pre-mRNA-splicing factor SLU7 n=1 Tax=Ascodesmis nigricans TaxID=341454 RepID=A0A4S2N739_9PEZI|nr:hypothetical protein EX30DRAFT_325915 [Ascodesmis nigricans]
MSSSRATGGTSSPSQRNSNPEKQSRNEYIPHFIAKKPFYIDDADEGDYLEHQRLQNKTLDDLSTSKWYNRGRKAAPAATKYRKGACTNCGAMTHSAKDCLSRPRKTGAKYTGLDIQADEVIESVELGWDGKRDRWNGYDPSEHMVVVEEHKRIEKLRKLEGKAKEDGEESGDDEDKEEKYAEDAEIPGQGYDSSARISTRNLRIREDTAKYLLNLDLDSARYDPKTRTMVDKGATSDRAAKLVEEEDFIRSSGDAAEFERLQRSAWESQERGDKTKLHLQANPTEAEILRKKQEAERSEAAEKKRKELLAKYGGAEHLEKKPEVEEQEVYIEYTETGQVKGQKPQGKIKSMYETIEDKYYGNHTSVWGSWWRNFKWGYACCHSTVKKSYCTGEAGIKANEEAENMRLGLVQPAERLQIESKEDHEEKESKEKGEKEEKEEDVRKDEKEEKARADTGLKASGQGREDDDKEGKRKLEHMLGGVTEDEMEAYRKRRALAQDPMANFKDVI